MKKVVKKAFLGIMAASLIAGMAPLTTVQVKAATVTKGEYNFSNMTVRRIWFNTDDPVFLIDNYQRVWLDASSNVLATGNYKTTGAEGDLMAPLKEACKQLGLVYTESGDNVSITMNGETLTFTIGSKDVVFNGTALSGALTDAQVPKKVNVKDTYADFNQYLTGDYYVTYLPVAYVFNKFGADIYVDSNIQSFYAAVPIFNTDTVPSYDTVASGYGCRYDEFIAGALKDTYQLSDAVASNIVALQNEDGGFAVLPENIDLEQADIKAALGSLVSESTLENGSTVAQLRYLAKYITEKKPTDGKYEAAFKKGISYLLSSQKSDGGWSMTASGEGFNANTAIGNDVTVSVLTLLNDVAVLNNQNYVFARRNMDMSDVKSAIEKGNALLVKTQISNDGVKAGWSTYVDAEGKPVMGRTYERASVSSFTTKAVVDYLMTIKNPSEDIINAVEAAVKWLGDVKIADKEAVVVKDTTMNNGFDVYLQSGSGTWAANYVYEADSKSYRPLYADVDPTKADQKLVNSYDLNGYSYDKSQDLIFYATRTSITYYDNALATALISIDYPAWKEYLKNGFPETPTDPAVDETPSEGESSTVEASTEAGTTPGGSGEGSGVGTGDRANVTLYGMLAFAALAAGMGTAVLKKKENKAE